MQSGAPRIEKQPARAAHIHRAVEGVEREPREGFVSAKGANAGKSSGRTKGLCATRLLSDMRIVRLVSTTQQGGEPTGTSAGLNATCGGHEKVEAGCEERGVVCERQRGA